jgi:hypothetical protein
MSEFSIQLVVDAKGAVKGIKDAAGNVVELDRVLGGASGTTQRFGRVLETALGVGLARAVEGLGRQIVNLANNGFRLLGESVRLAGVQDIAERKLETALRNLGAYTPEAAARLKALASEVQSFSNFGDESILTAQAMLASFRSVSGSEGIALLTPRLADMAAGVAKATGQTADLNSVATALGKSLEGNAGSLRRYGVSLSEAEEAAFNAASGMERVQMLASILDANFSGLAEATADPFVQLQNSVGDLKEQIGMGLLPVARDLALRLKALAENEQVIERVRNAASALASALLSAAEAASMVLGFIARNRAGIGEGAKAMGALAAAVSAYVVSLQVASLWGARHTLMLKGVAMWTNLTTVAQQRLTLAMKANPWGLALAAIAGLVTWLTLQKPRTDEVKDATDRLTESVARQRDMIVLTTKASAEQAKTQLESSLALLDAQRETLVRQEAEIRARALNARLGSTELANLNRALYANREAQAALGKEAGRTAEALDSVNRRMATLGEESEAIPPVLQQVGEALAEVPQAGDTALTFLERLQQRVQDLRAEVEALKGTPFVDLQRLTQEEQALRRLQEQILEAARKGPELIKDVSAEGFKATKQMQLSVAESASRVAAQSAHAREREQQEQQAFVDRHWGTIQEVASQTAQVLGGISALRQAQHQRELQEIDRQESAALKSIDAQLAREDLAESERERLTAMREATERRFARMRAEATRKAAEVEKKIALVQIAVETAINTVKAWPNPFLMAAAVGQGALQAAVVRSQPLPDIPAFNRGGIVPGSGPNRDSVLAALTPGEGVVNRASTIANRGLIDAMNARPGMALGGMDSGVVSEIRALRGDVQGVQSRIAGLELRADYGGLYVGMKRYTDRVSQTRTLG